MAIFILLFSFITFAGSVIAIPLAIGRLDCNYFCAFAQRVEKGESKEKNGAFFVWALVRNTFGLVLVALGLAIVFLRGNCILRVLVWVITLLVNLTPMNQRLPILELNHNGRNENTKFQLLNTLLIRVNPYLSLFP